MDGSNIAGNCDSSVSILFPKPSSTHTLNPTPNPNDNSNLIQKGSDGSGLVLESKGTWIHAGYHLTSATAGPALLSLPFAMTFVGWGPGLVALLFFAGMSFYSYCLLVLVLEHLEKSGKRFIRYGDLADYALGPKWNFYLVSPLQFVICFITVIGAVLIGGVCMKEIYKTYSTGHSWRLYEFTVIFGAVTSIMAQLPSFHSLRHVNLVSLLLCLGYSFCSTFGSILAGYNDNVPAKDYSITGDEVHKVFGVFGALSIFANTYGNAVVAEIQATIAPPVTGKMVKGLSLCYVVILCTFVPVTISGYWAFGNTAKSNIFDNMRANGILLVPEKLLLSAYFLVILQLVAISLVYLQPGFEVLEENVADRKKGRYALRNLLPRLLGRTFFVGLATFFAAMLPFFGDINALMGALGYTPLVFVFPLIFYLSVFRPSKTSFRYWVHLMAIIAFSILTIVGSLAAFGQLIIDAKKFRLFADL